MADDGGETQDRVSLNRHQRIGLVAGPLLFVAMLLLDAPAGMSGVAWRVAAAGSWMALWWATEAVPVPVTAMLPIVLFAPLGIAPLRDVAAPYANPIIYLYLGGFMVALAVERWGLHRRIALTLLQATGTGARRLVGGFMLTCALLSMWMTNTATAMMMLPIAASVIGIIASTARGVGERQLADFRVAVMLGVAYGATIGGLATLIGTPPNALLAAFMAETYGVRIGFAEWMMVGVPVTLVLLLLGWLVLTRVAFRVDFGASEQAHAHLATLRAKLGGMSKAERRIAVIFAMVVFGWIFREPINALLGTELLSDPGIVMTAAVLLFLVPSGDPAMRTLMSWGQVARLPWGVLVLFGGGLSLAAAVSNSGLALWLGQSLAPLGAAGPLLLIMGAATLVIFLTELTSNLATAATFLPVVAAIAVQSGMEPLSLTVPVTVAASCAFMLPVATPPNAIVFASGMLSIPQMVRAGFLMNLAGIAVLVAVALWLAPLLL